MRQRARGVGFGVLAGVVLAIAILSFRGGEARKYTLVFENAGQLIKGNEVKLSGRTVGVVRDIGLNDRNQARVKIELDDDSLTALPSGTRATVRQPSLSSVAGRYISLQLGAGPDMSSGSTIPVDQTLSTVDLDQLFNTLDAPTRKGLQQVVQGSATWFEGRGAEGNEAVKYFAPALSGLRRLFGEITADQDTFEDLVVNGAKVTRALAEKRTEITSLVGNANAATGAIADESEALDATLAQLPTTLRRANSTFVNLRATLDDLAPLVDVTKEQSKDLAPFLRELRPVLEAADPAIDDLAAIVSTPGTDNDLTDLLKTAPSIAQTAKTSFASTTKALDDSLPFLSFARPYAPDLVGLFRGLGQANAYYDANGHFARVEPVSRGFRYDPATNELVGQAASDRLRGVQTGVVRRCPGSAGSLTADGSGPFTDGGKLDCDATKVVPGP